MIHTTEGPNAREGSYAMGIGAAIGGAVCLGLTGFILHTFGKQLGTTLEGKQILSWANVAVHILGFVFMGLALGYFLNPRTRNWWWAIPCGLVMLSAGGLTFTNLYGFASGERISATRAVEDAKKRIADTAAERKALAQKRQEAQERLAGSQLKFMQAEVKDAEGKARRQLTKDFAKNSSQIIAEIGKENTAAAAPKIEVELDPDVGAAELAAITGLTTQAMQVAMAMWIAKLLVSLEMLLWPMASFTWPRKVAGTSKIIDADYRDVPAKEAAPELGPGLQASVLEAPQLTALLAQPEPPVADNSSAHEPTPPRFPLPGSEASLAEIGFPLGKAVSGPKRHKRSPEEAAQGFKVWMQAFDIVREPLSDAHMTRLYAEYCEADHREAAAENLMRGELRKLRGVQWSKQRDEHGKKTARWVIKPGKYPKAAAPVPKQEGRVFAFPRPLAEAPAHEPAHVDANATSPERVDETAKRRQIPVGNKQAFQALNIPAREHPAIQRAVAHAMRREGRNKKQRGNRMGRRAA